MVDEEGFRVWGRGVVDESAAGLVAHIAGARAGSRSSLGAGYEAVYVHFTDARLPQSLCVWLYSALAGSDNNFRGYPDVIGVGLKHDADEELEQGAWRFRLQGSRFRWRTHCDARYAGFRLTESAGELRALSTHEAASRVSAAVVRQLERAGAITSA